MGSIPRLWDPLEEEMEAHSNILSWKIPWTEEPGRPQSMEAQRAGHDWVTKSIVICHCNCAWLITQAVLDAEISQDTVSAEWIFDGG